MGRKIPDQFFREAWEDANHEMACVCADNKFVRVNHAFERMLGYSQAELIGRSWMEFTEQEDVGGDLASVQSVIDGTVQSYQMEKDYIHKRGHKIPVILNVRRFPRSSLDPLVFFRVESPVSRATRVELREVDEHHLKLISALEKRLEKMEEKGFVSVSQSANTGSGDQWRDGSKAGGDISSNSDKMIKMVCGVMVAIVFSLVWIVYYTMTSHRTQMPVAPPSIPVQQSSE